MTDLAPELEMFSSLMDAQPAPVRATLHDCLALVMVESGKARPKESGGGLTPSFLDCQCPKKKGGSHPASPFSLGRWFSSRMANGQQFSFWQIAIHEWGTNPTGVLRDTRIWPVCRGFIRVFVSEFVDGSPRRVHNENCWWVPA
jgi:hypothetical protein